MAEDVAALLDTVDLPWREWTAGIRVGDHPRAPGKWGVFDPETLLVWIGHAAFANARRLEYVALHETAHGLQVHAGTLPRYEHELPHFERIADCLARRWGATIQVFGCSPEADEHALELIHRYGLRGG